MVLLESAASEDVFLLLFGSVLLLVLLATAILYALPGIVLLRKGHVSGAVLCFILTGLIFLSALLSEVADDPWIYGGVVGWFFFGGGFLWLLLLVWAAGAPDLVYRRRQSAIIDDLHNRLKRIERRVASLETYNAQAIEAPPPAKMASAPLPSYDPWHAAAGNNDPTPVQPLPPVVAAPSQAQPLPSLVNDPDATPIMPMGRVAEPAVVEIKVRCKACGKKFGGLPRNIEALKVCPRCKASPFEYTTA